MEKNIIFFLIIFFLILIFLNKRKEKFIEIDTLTIIPDPPKLTMEEYIAWLFKNKFYPINPRHRENLKRYLQGYPITDIPPINLPMVSNPAEIYRFAYLRGLVKAGEYQKILDTNSTFTNSQITGNNDYQIFAPNKKYQSYLSDELGDLLIQQFNLEMQI
jgi:hypothetical protein